jgi:hypothetical protein
LDYRRACPPKDFLREWLHLDFPMEYLPMETLMEFPQKVIQTV